MKSSVFCTGGGGRNDAQMRYYKGALFFKNLLKEGIVFIILNRHVDPSQSAAGMVLVFDLKPFRSDQTIAGVWDVG